MITRHLQLKILYLIVIKEDKQARSEPNDFCHSLVGFGKARRSKNLHLLLKSPAVTLKKHWE